MSLSNTTTLTYRINENSFTHTVSSFIKSHFDIEWNEDKLAHTLNPDMPNIFCIDNFEIALYLKDITDPTVRTFYVDITPLDKPTSIRYSCEFLLCFKADNYIDLVKNHIIPNLSLSFLSKFPYIEIESPYKERRYYDLKTGEQLDLKTVDGDEVITVHIIPDTRLVPCSPDSIECSIIFKYVDELEIVNIIIKNILRMRGLENRIGYYIKLIGMKDGYDVDIPHSVLVNMMYLWLPVEMKYYKKLNARGANKYSYLLSGLLKYPHALDYANLTTTDKQNKPITKKEFYSDYGLNLWDVSNIISFNRFVTLALHKNARVDFSIHPSIIDGSELLKYTTDVTEVYKNAFDNIFPTAVKLQKTFLKYKQRTVEKPFPNIPFFNKRISDDVFIYSRYDRNVSRYYMDYLFDMDLYPFFAYKYEYSLWYTSNVKLILLRDISPLDTGWNVLLYTSEDKYYSYKIYPKRDRLIFSEPKNVSSNEYHQLQKEFNNYTSSYGVK